MSELTFPLQDEDFAGYSTRMQLNRKADYDLFSYSPKVNNGCLVQIFNNSLLITNNLKKFKIGKPPEREQGDIKKFSQNARRRFIKKLAHINLQLYDKPLFVTLTYQNELPLTAAELSEQLNRFLTKLRRYGTKFHYVWRLEFQKRGAPHFHFILLPFKNTVKKRLYLFHNDILRMWRYSINSWSEAMQKYAVNVQWLDGKKNIFSYISKYAAKEDAENNELYTNRRYGFSNGIFLHPIKELQIPYYDFQLLRKLIVAFMKRNNNLDYEFEKYLWYDPTVEILISLEDMKVIFDTFSSLRNSHILDDFLTEFEKLDFTA